MLNMNDAREFAVSKTMSYINRTGKGTVGFTERLYNALFALYYIKNKGLSDSISSELIAYTSINFSNSDDYVKLIKALQTIEYEDYMAVYSSIVDEVLTRSTSSNIILSYFSKPASLTTLICELLKKKGITSLYNPFAHFASIPIELQIENFCSQEIDDLTLAIGHFLLDAHGLDVNNYSVQSPLEAWNPISSDFVASIPPFSYNDPKRGDVPARTYEEYMIWQFSRSIEKYAIYVVPDRICYDSSKIATNLRKAIIDNNYLEMVISLPSGIFASTGISTSLIVLNKERNNTSDVVLVDAKELIIAKNKREKALDVNAIMACVANPESDNCALVSKDNVTNSDYKWSVSYYLSKMNESVPEGYKAIEMRAIVEPIKPNRTYNEVTGHIANISQLSKDAADYMRSPESFEISRDLKKAAKLEEPALLLSTIGVLKPTYCSASPENPVFIHPHVRAFRLKENWVNPAYLCLQLSKSKGYAVGAFVPHINLSEILRVKVAFPSIGSQQSFDEQARLYNEAMESAKLAKAKELGLQEVINKMKAEYMIEVRNRKHDMKTPMTQLRNTLTLLDSFAKGLPEEQSLKLQGYINRQRVAVDTLSEIVRHLADEESFAIPEPLDIEPILRSFEEKNDRYDIVYYTDEIGLNEIGDGKAIVNMGKSDFVRLVNNIIGNAIEHGFVDNTVHYALAIILRVVEGAFMIRFVNNGKPLPEGMDKARYGMKGVKGKDSKGQGTGGSVVKSITEHYGGDYDIYTKDADGKQLTVVDIKLPIYQTDE